MQMILSFKVAKSKPQNASAPRQGRSIRELWLESTAKKLRRRKNRSPEIHEAEKCLAENGVTKAITAEQVFHQHDVLNQNETI
jgi:hypothetical protein